MTPYQTDTSDGKLAGLNFDNYRLHSVRKRLTVEKSVSMMRGARTLTSQATDCRNKPRALGRKPRAYDQVTEKYAIAPKDMSGEICFGTCALLLWLVGTINSGLGADVVMESFPK